MASIETIKTENKLLRQYVIGLQHQNNSLNRQIQILKQQIGSIKDLKSKLQEQNKILRRSDEVTILKQQIQKIKKQKEIIMEQYNEMHELVSELEKIQSQFLNRQKQIISLRQQNLLLRNQFETYLNNNNFQTPFDYNSLKIQLQEALRQREQFKQANQCLIQQLRLIEKKYKSQLQKYTEKSRQKISNIIITNEENSIELNSKNQYINRYHLNLSRLNPISQENLNSAQNTNKKSSRKLDQLNKQQLVQQINILQKQLFYAKTINKQNSYIINVQSNFQQKNQEICYLNQHIHNLQVQIQQKDTIIKKKTQNIQQLQKVIIQLDKQKARQSAKYRAIIDSKNNQLNNLSQAYKLKINDMNNDLQKAKQIIQQLKNLNKNSVQLNLMRRNLLKIQQQNTSLRISCNQKQSLICLLKKQIQSLIDKKYQKLDFKQTLLSPIKYYNNITENNFNSPKKQIRDLILNLKNELQQVKIQNKKIQNENEKMHLILSGRKKYDQKQNKNSYNSPRTHNVNKTADLQTMKCQAKRMHSPHIKSFSKNDKYAQKPLTTALYQLNQHNLFQNHKNMENNLSQSKNHVFKHIIKPVSQIKLYEKNQNNENKILTLNNIVLNNGSQFFQSLQTKTQQKDQTNLNKIEDGIQKRINYLRNQNKNLKKTLFQ